jgi:hypothetical protein
LKIDAANQIAPRVKAMPFPWVVNDGCGVAYGSDSLVRAVTTEPCRVYKLKSICLSTRSLYETVVREASVKNVRESLGSNPNILRTSSPTLPIGTGCLAELRFYHKATFVPGPK